VHMRWTMLTRRRVDVDAEGAVVVHLDHATN
jgi:hypothetical protein